MEEKRVIDVIWDFSFVRTAKRMRRKIESVEFSSKGVCDWCVREEIS